MTRTFKIVLLFMTVILITLIVMTGMFLQNSAKENKDELKQMYLRREDLLNQHQKLILMVGEVNQTLQSEIKKNEDLVNELAKVMQENAATEELRLAQEKIIAEQRAAQERAAAAAAEAAKQAAKKPTPRVPKTVTRAS